jgi:glycosyltransferase involved in cell wall biosynthesis
VWLLARGLARTRAFPQIIVTGRHTQLAERLRANGVPVRECDWDAGLDPRVLLAIAAELRSGPALLHAHDAHALTLAGMLAALSRTPLVVTRRVDFPLRRRGFWRRADRVIAISEAVARVLRDDGIDPGRIVVVHSGVDLTEARRAVPAGIRGDLGLSDSAKLAVNVGALVPHKDHATLLRSAAHLREPFPDLHWAIAGEGPLRGELESLRERLGLRECVHLLGHVSNPLNLLAEADVFVMSSREEGLGTSVLDAMACGIPVASTTAGGLPEMLGDGAGILVPPEQPEALAAAVGTLLHDPEMRRQVRDRARMIVQGFSAERMAEQVGTVYRSCAIN